MNIECDLYAQWIVAIRQDLTRQGFSHSSLSDQNCAITWHTWRRRIVPAGKRKILKAKGFICPPSLQQGVADLEQAFINGSVIWPWQSKFIDHPSFEDGLFNDYRVVHFHLGIGFEANGYIKRKGELLFAFVNSTSVYEIGIYRHGNWYELDILDIIDENWPYLLDVVTLQCSDVANCIKTREEIKQLREAKVNLIMKLKSGRIVAPPGGSIAIDGTSTEAVRSVIHRTKLLHKREKFIIANIKELVEKGSLEMKDYIVSFSVTDNEAYAAIGKLYKWPLWEENQTIK